MIVRVLIGTLSEEDLALYRLAHLPLDAASIVPSAFSRRDIEEALLTTWRLKERLVKQFEIDDTKDWSVSVYTGIVFYEEEPA